MNDNKKVVCWDILEHLKTEKKLKCCCSKTKNDIEV